MRGAVYDGVGEVYLDYNASSPLDPRVAEAMMPILTDAIGNASSVHRFGRRQAAAVDDAREHVAALVGGARIGCRVHVGSNRGQQPGAARCGRGRARRQTADARFGGGARLGGGERRGGSPTAA